MILELFAGPGGWAEGLRSLGLDDFGLEIDETACATRYAAGHACWQTDVASVDPAAFSSVGVEGLIASPPCQDFSVAGSRVGLDGLRGKLVTEVLRWAHVLKPRWIACEQVPTVLPVWRAFARDLEDAGYRTWTGVLNTADYAVPQTRNRAILMASRDEFDPPAPTHAHNETVGDFFSPPRRRWITMAEALGWGLQDQPSTTVMSRGPGGSPRPLDGGAGSRAVYERAKREGRWIVNTGLDWKPGGNRETAQQFDPHSQPAKTVTTESGRQWQLRAGVHRPTAPRNPLLEPAPTLAFGHDAAQWAWERPATTISGDARCWPPGHKVNAADVGRLGDEAYERYGDRAGTEAIRLAPEEAAVLQGFRHDYPFQGSRTKKFEQIGNAVPPPLAAAIIRCLHQSPTAHRR